MNPYIELAKLVLSVEVNDYFEGCLDKYPLTVRSLDKDFRINADQSDSMHAIVEQCFSKAMITIARFHTHQPEYVDDRKNRVVSSYIVK